MGWDGIDADAEGLPAASVAGLIVGPDLEWVDAVLTDGIGRLRLRLADEPVLPRLEFTCAGLATNDITQDYLAAKARLIRSQD